MSHPAPRLASNSSSPDLDRFQSGIAVHPHRPRRHRGVAMPTPGADDHAPALPNGSAPRTIVRRSTSDTICGGRSEKNRPRARDSLISQPTERLEADLYDLAGRLSVGTYELLVLIGELDHRASWAAF